MDKVYEETFSQRRYTEKQFKNETVPSADGEEPGLSHSSGVCVCERVQPLWKTLWQCLKRLNLELPPGPAIL